MTIDTSPSSTSATTTILRVSRVLVWFVYAYVVVCEVLLGLGFVLRLFGANPSAGFVQWVYRSLERVMAPFRGIFPPIELGTNTSDVPAVLDTSILFAMLVYGIVLLALRSLIDWLTRRVILSAAASAPGGRRSPPAGAGWAEPYDTTR
jgi:hypothetical protein